MLYVARVGGNVLYAAMVVALFARDVESTRDAGGAVGVGSNAPCAALDAGGAGVESNVLFATDFAGDSGGYAPCAGL